MNEKRGNVRYLWILVGGYLLYIAWDQVKAIYHGETPLPLVSGGGAVVFAVVGVLVLYREWKAYQYAQEHKDDPETWSGEDAGEDGGENGAIGDGASPQSRPLPDAPECSEDGEEDALSEEALSEEAPHPEEKRT